MRNPGKEDRHGVKWILKYLRGVVGHGILYGRVNEATTQVFGFVDSDFARNLDKRRSIIGFMYAFCGAEVSRKASLQLAVTLSATEAKYIALTEVAKKTI